MNRFEHFKELIDNSYGGKETINETIELLVKEGYFTPYQLGENLIQEMWITEDIYENWYGITVDWNKDLFIYLTDLNRWFNELDKFETKYVEKYIQLKENGDFNMNLLFECYERL